LGDIVSAAKQQVDSLKRTGIRVSLGDAKVILMGRMLCEIHKMGNPVREGELLDRMERDIDTFASQVIMTEGEVLYERAASGPEQLTLFEKLENYLTTNR